MSDMRIRMLILGPDGSAQHGVEMDLPHPESRIADRPEILAVMSPDAQKAQAAGHGAQDWLEDNKENIRAALYNLLVRSMLYPDAVSEAVE